MKVRYSPRATRDLDAIHEYLAERSPRGAFNVMAAIYTTIKFVRRNPEAAPMVARIPGVRGTTAGRYRFKVFYRVLSSEEVARLCMSVIHRAAPGRAKPGRH